MQLLFADARYREAAIVVPGIDEAIIRQREDLRAHRVKQAVGVAALEIGAPAAADEERVAGEGHRAVVEHIGGAAAGMAGRGARFEVARAERRLVLRAQVDIGAFGAARRRDGDAAARA